MFQFMISKPKCKVDGCSSPIVNIRGWCNKHYCQIRRRGYIYRTKKDLNLYIPEGETTKIELTDAWGRMVDYCIIDTNCVDKVKHLRWGLTKGYVWHAASKVRLASFLLPCPFNHFIDHINGDPLDNRMCNLRIATYAENARNTQLAKNNSSGFKGVWKLPSGNYSAKICIDYRQINIGTYKTKEEAARAYDRMALKHHGRFAKLNFEE